MGSLEQIFEKFVGNIRLIFLQFEKFSVKILDIHYYKFKKKLESILKILMENFEESWIILKKCNEKLKIFNKNSEKTFQKFECLRFFF